METYDLCICNYTCRDLIRTGRYKLLLNSSYIPVLIRYFHISLTSLLDNRVTSYTKY